MGRRIRQTEYDGSSGSWTVVSDIKMVYDGWQCITEMNATNNAVIRSYVWGVDLSGTQTGADGVGGLVMTTIYTGINAGTYFPAYDGNGNVSALVNSSNGEVTANYEYGPFGEPTRVSGVMSGENPFRFSTKRTVDSIDIILYEYRPYKPSTGTWLTRDPIGEKGGRNLYEFVGNAPLIKIDRLGLYCVCSKNPSSCKKIPNTDSLAIGSDWEFMGVVPIDWQHYGGAMQPGKVNRFGCKWQRKFSSLFKCCDGQVFATGGLKGTATEVEWGGNDDVIMYNPLALPWGPTPGIGNLYELVIDTLGHFVPSPFVNNYLNYEEKEKLEGMCRQNKPTAEAMTKTMIEPIVPKCN